MYFLVWYACQVSTRARGCRVGGCGRLLRRRGTAVATTRQCQCALWPSEIFRNLSGSAASIGIGSAALDGRTSVHPTRALISSKRRMMWLGTTGDQTKARKFPAPWRDGIGRDWVMSCVNFDLKRTTTSASPRTRRAVDRLFAIAPRRKTRVVTSTVTRHGQGVPSRSRAHRGWQTGRPPSRRLARSLLNALV